MVPQLADTQNGLIWTDHPIGCHRDEPGRQINRCGQFDQFLNISGKILARQSGIKKNLASLLLILQQVQKSGSKIDGWFDQFDLI